MAKKLLILFLIFTTSLTAAENVHFILTGGPALRQWENLRIENNRHDRWWANFIRASTLRMVELRQAYGKESKIVWAVYKDGYTKRGKEDSKPYTTWIENLAKKRNVKLIWFKSGDQAINAINSQPRSSITTFDFFGHSNRYCFMLDYSSKISSASKAWIHQQDLYKIKKYAFKDNCISQSWGCYTGESMSEVWRRRIGHTLVGAQGKTDYVPVGKGKMPAINGTWVR